MLNIPGIGEYTSSSISAILKDEACAVIDGNIERILLRVFDLNRSEKNFKKKIKILAQKLTPLKNNKDYFQSLMDLANIICKKSVYPNAFYVQSINFVKVMGKLILNRKIELKDLPKLELFF